MIKVIIMLIIILMVSGCVNHSLVCKNDGFNTWKEFDLYFSEKYDLSQPKRFVIYRWRWENV